MRPSDTVIAALALAALLTFLLSHSSKFWRAPASAVRHLKLHEEEFGEKKRLLAELYALEILSLCAGSFLFGLLYRRLGLGWPLALVPALLTSLVTIMLLAPLSLRFSTVRDLESASLPRVSRRLAVWTGRLLALSSWFSPGERGAGDSGTGPVAGAWLTGNVRGTPPIESPYGRDLLRLLLRLRDRHVSEVMVPRLDMVCAGENSTIAELAELAAESGHTRIPIVADTIDSVKGYVTAKEVVLKLHRGHGDERVSSVMRKPVFVTPRTSIESCLKQLQKEHASLAIVAERSGRTVGLVTSEDILEEVAGDFYEDVEPDEPAYSVMEDGIARVRASVKLGDMKEILGEAPAHDPGETLGDYLRQRLPSDPVPGDRVSDELFVYTVLRTVGKTVWSVRVEKRR
jgi:Mg2+/Co2+ transporter CorC